ncbi:hypothetical protein R3P38DRAFT_3504800 [Favolaschia claudopus]|uniref:F-box domain-containing protein n=1 Tax=Favolaschia claudopus TaxID=2862362 RepID=A0AAV9Z395_9AGAR
MLKLLEEALSLKGPVASNPETPPDHMHRALLIPEIVWTIVSQLDRTTSDGSGALVALARCKIFHSHALDSLWRFPGSVRRFLACLPDDLWNTPRDGFLRWDTLMRPRREIEISEWDRVLYYSRRVRHITSEKSGAQWISSLAKASELKGHQDALFPNLDSDSIGSQESSLLALQSHTAALANITDLRIDGYFGHPIEDPPGINHLDLNTGLNATALRHLGRLPNLEHLLLNLTDTDTLGFTAFDDFPRNALFRSLRSLSITSDETEAVNFSTTLVRSFSNTHLDSMEINLDSYELI